MPYQVPDYIDSNKFFLVDFAELEGRLDPAYVLYRQKIANDFSFPIRQLKEVLVMAPQYGTAESGIVRKSDSEPRYIRITDIDEYGNLTVILGATAEKLEEQYLLKENDILFARSGATVGKTYLHKERPYSCYFAGYMIRVVVDEALMLPEYLFIYTQLETYKEWVKAVQRVAAQPNINAEEYKSLPIPLPPLSVQKEIVDLYNTALLNRKKKLDESIRKLSSIDTYLLNVLGIKLQEPKPQLLQDRMFVVCFDEVNGGRLDPKLYSGSTKQLKQSLNESPFGKQPLKDFITDGCSGEWGKDESEEVNEDKYTKCLVIRATEFDNIYNLRLENSRVKYRWIENTKLSKMNIQPNDLLIEKSGGSDDQPVGRISILTNDILQDNIIAYSNFIHKITVTGINPMYLYYYLKTMHNIKITDAMQSQTNGIRNLIMSEYFNQTIVVPPTNIQDEIVNHITNLRKQAKTLQAEAREILENAQKEVEAMILGGNTTGERNV